MDYRGREQKVPTLDAEGHKKFSGASEDSSQAMVFVVDSCGKFATELYGPSTKENEEYVSDNRQNG